MVIGATFKVIYSIYLEWHRSGPSHRIFYALCTGLYHIAMIPPDFLKGGYNAVISRTGDWEPLQQDLSDLKSEVQFLRTLISTGNNSAPSDPPRPPPPPSNPPAYFGPQRPTSRGYELSSLDPAPLQRLLDPRVQSPTPSAPDCRLLLDEHRQKATYLHRPETVWIRPNPHQLDGATASETNALSGSSIMARHPADIDRTIVLQPPGPSNLVAPSGPMPIIPPPQPQQEPSSPIRAPHAPPTPSTPTQRAPLRNLFSLRPTPGDQLADQQRSLSSPTTSTRSAASPPAAEILAASPPLSSALLAQAAGYVQPPPQEQQRTASGRLPPGVTAPIEVYPTISYGSVRAAMASPLINVAPSVPHRPTTIRLRPTDSLFSAPKVPRLDAPQQFLQPNEDTSSIASAPFRQDRQEPDDHDQSQNNRLNNFNPQ